MKRTPLFAITILCMALMSCASTDNTLADTNNSNHRPGNPQATEPEEMHGHSMNATGVSTAETSVKGGSATVVAGNAMESPTRGTNTTIVTTPGVAQVDANLVPNTNSRTTVSGTSGTGTATMTDNTATMSGNSTVSGNTSANTSQSTWNNNTNTSGTTASSQTNNNTGSSTWTNNNTTGTTSGTMTSSTMTDDDDDDNTATTSRRRMRKD